MTEEQKRYLYEEQILLKPYYNAFREYENGVPMEKIINKYGKDIEEYILILYDNPKQKR
tara:strand:+ start:1209 stop:1385 length:177 start_codon:yes stop_codon:yes gene_type:complete